MAGKRNHSGKTTVSTFAFKQESTPRILANEDRIPREGAIPAGFSD